MTEQLTDRVRAGDIGAFGQLYTRYRTAASSYARYFTRCGADQDDLTAEAFARILSTLRGGKGPTDENFLGYLATTVRHVAFDRGRRRQREQLANDIEAAAVDADPMMILVDRDIATNETRNLVRAMRNLEIRWQVVLFLLDIKGLPLAKAAEVLRLSPNATSALAYRARTRLRIAQSQ